MHILIDNGSDYFFVRLIPIWFFKGRLLHSKRRPFVLPSVIYWYIDGYRCLKNTFSLII